MKSFPARIHIDDRLGVERHLIIERTSADLDVARANGRRGGRRSAIDESKRKMIDNALKTAKKNNRPPNLSGIATSSPSAIEPSAAAAKARTSSSETEAAINHFSSSIKRDPRSV